MVVRQAMFLKVSKKKQIEMPLCKYGLACTRKDCVFRHPPKPPSKPSVDPHSDDSSNEAAADLCLPYLAGTCAFGDSCFSYHPPAPEVERLKAKFASKWCRFGSTCKTKGCLFRHHNPTSALLSSSDSPSSPVTTPTCTTVPTVFASGPTFRSSPPPTAPVSAASVEHCSIPAGVFLSYEDSLASRAWAIEDPIERFAFVNEQHNLKTSEAAADSSLAESASPVEDEFVLDLHFQSARSVEVVLDQILPQIIDYLASPLAANKNVWLVTGAGRHVPTNSHQKHGGVLFEAVLDRVLSRLRTLPDLEVHAGIDSKSSPSPGAVRIRKKK